MTYYKIFKNNILIGIGNTQNSVTPKNDKHYTYSKITEQAYQKLNKQEFNGK